ncbi:vanadium-dependent haloperoxidase [Spirillospora sp. NBC_00431]
MARSSTREETASGSAVARRRLIQTLAIAPLTGVAALGTRPAVADGRSPAAAPDFDWDNGDVFFEFLYPTINPVIRRLVSPRGMDAPQVLRTTTLLTTSWFDAIAPYHPTAVGIYSRLGRRPSSERATKRHRNIAIMYASYRILNVTLAQNADGWRKMMTSAGLDPDDDRENRTSPSGIGNLAAKGVLNAKRHDGMNQLGDKGGQKYNRQPYMDYTGYEPANTAYELRDPSRWQPAILTKGTGIFTVQQASVPQWGRTKPYSFTDPKEFIVPPPKNSDYRNKAAYRRQVDEILAASAGLTEEQKLMAEFFNDKFKSIGYAAISEAHNRKLGLDEYVHISAATDIAAYDTGIVVWLNKYKYDAMRPFTAVRHVYGGQRVTAWGGPGKGKVKDLPAEDWLSYLEVGDFPEYPSGSTTIYGAVAQLGRRFFGSEEINLSWTFAKGSTDFEPGITPTADRTVRWTSWSQFAREGGLSRLWGGVHFMSAIEVGWKVGPRLGDRVYEFIRDHVEGRPTP